MVIWTFVAGTTTVIPSRSFVSVMHAARRDLRMERVREGERRARRPTRVGGGRVARAAADVGVLFGSNWISCHSSCTGGPIFSKYSRATTTWSSNDAGPSPCVPLTTSQFGSAAQPWTGRLWCWAVSSSVHPTFPGTVTFVFCFCRMKVQFTLRRGAHALNRRLRGRR